MVVASGGYDLPAFEKLTTLKVWAEEGPAEGHALPLSEPAQSPDPVGRGAAGAAEDRRADLHPGDPRPRWSCASCRASRWKRPSPGPRARSKATCGPELALRLRGRPVAIARRRARSPLRRGLADGRCGIADIRMSEPLGRRRAGFAPDAAAQVDHRVPDDAAADPADRAAGDLSGALFDPSRDLEQVDGALRRLRQFHVPVQARNILDGGAAVLHLRHHRGDLQSADRLHRRAFRPQHSRQEASASGAACCWCRG